FQGETARDPVVRSTLRAIAADEASHAALGWSIDAWAGARLTAAGRARVAEARHAAYARLLDERAEANPLLGLPGPEAAARMLDALSPIWSSAS
ncbi:MAG: ferritin-like domain-containing protein, partial [Myxococcales bacterium]